jgi:hypothetical protein
VPARFDIDATVRGAAGRADLTAEVDTRDSVRWEVRKLAFEDVDVARIAGQPGPSAVSGTVIARGKGGDVTAELALEDAHYGDWTLAAAQARVQSDASGRFRLSDGRVAHLALAESVRSGRFSAGGRSGRELAARAKPCRAPLLRGSGRRQLTAELARGSLVIDGMADSPAGRIHLAAEARPFEKTPTYDVHSLRFEHVDAGARSNDRRRGRT